MTIVAGPRRPLLSPNAWIVDLRKKVDDSTGTEVVAEMSSVDRVCSEDLNELIRIHLELTAQGRKLVLENTLEHLMAVFTMTRLDRLIEFRTAIGA